MANKVVCDGTFSKGLSHLVFRNSRRSSSLFITLKKMDSYNNFNIRPNDEK